MQIIYLLRYLEYRYGSFTKLTISVLIKNKIHKYDFLVIGAGMIGCLTALSLLKKKFKVLVIDKGDLSINDTRTLAVNAKSRDFLKNLNLWNEIKKTQPIKNIYIKDYINSEELIFKNKEEDMGTVIYNKELLLKTRKILLNKKILYKNINISFVDLLQAKKLIISNKQIEFKKIILTVGKFFNNELIVNKKSFTEGHTSYVGFFQHTKNHNNNAYEIFTAKGPLAVLPAPHESQKYSTFIYSSKSDRKINFQTLISNNFNKTHGKTNLSGDIKNFNITPHISSPIENDLLLLGDTLRSIHPVAGQGWNLGVKDILTFINLLDRYSIDNPNLNKFYYARRKVDSFVYLSFTSLLNLLYENENNFNKLFIKFGYQALLKTSFLRDIFIKQAMGRISLI